MKLVKHFGRLMKDIFGFAAANAAWWIIPLVLVLIIVGVVLVAGTASTPFIYTLF